MKRLIVVCEGPTEQEFCRDTIAPYLSRHSILVEEPLIKQSNGGMVSWPAIRLQLLSHLHESGAYVTTMFDYYGIKDSYAFPKWTEGKTIDRHEERVCFLEEAMKENIGYKFAPHFIPHLQLHEFEAMLFSNIEVFPRNYAKSDLDMGKLKSIVQDFPNPEDINNSPSTAPSKRILDAVKGYDKVLDGNFLAKEIGINTIMAKCPHFKQWIEVLENL